MPKLKEEKTPRNRRELWEWSERFLRRECQVKTGTLVKEKTACKNYKSWCYVRKNYSRNGIAQGSLRSWAKARGSLTPFGQGLSGGPEGYDTDWRRDPHSINVLVAIRGAGLESRPVVSYSTNSIFFSNADSQSCLLDAFLLQISAMHALDSKINLKKY